MLEHYFVLVLQLVIGIQTIAPAGRPIPPRRALAYAQAALYHAQRKQLDPFELIALARNESDFNDKTVGPDGLDCGLTQTRITYSRYSCEELKRSPFLAFAEAARELSAYEKSCRGRLDYDRCRLNRYNSGTRYARKGFHSRYYLRLFCFAAAARQRLPFQERCRSVQSEEQLAVWIRGAAPPAEPDTMVAQGPASAPYSGVLHEPPPPWQVTVLAVGLPADAVRDVAIVDRPGRGHLRALRRGVREGRRGGRVRSGHHAQRPLDLLAGRRLRSVRARPRGALGPLTGQDAADGSDHACPRPGLAARRRRGLRVG